jgi:hypothetical protein
MIEFVNMAIRWGMWILVAMEGNLAWALAYVFRVGQLFQANGLML